MQGFPKVQLVRIGGQPFAQIQDKRYALKEVGGSFCLSEPDMVDIIDRFAPPGARDDLLARVRNMCAEAQGSSGSLQ